MGLAGCGGPLEGGSQAEGGGSQAVKGGCGRPLGGARRLLEGGSQATNAGCERPLEGGGSQAVAGARRLLGPSQAAYAGTAGARMGLIPCRINRIKMNNIFITILLCLCNV